MRFANSGANGATEVPVEREFFIDNLLVRIHFIIKMIWWTGLAPWECKFPFPGSLISTFLLEGPVTCEASSPVIVCVLPGVEFRGYGS